MTPTTPIGAYDAWVDPVGSVFKERDYRFDRWVRVVRELQTHYVVESVREGENRRWRRVHTRQTQIRKDRLIPRFWEFVTDAHDHAAFFDGLIEDCRACRRMTAHDSATPGVTA